MPTKIAAKEPTATKIAVVRDNTACVFVPE